jgi:hypothetical protein
MKNNLMSTNEGRVEEYKKHEELENEQEKKRINQHTLIV